MRKPSTDLSETPSHLDGDGIFFGKGEPDKGITFQSNNEQIIMTLLIESVRLGKMGLL